MKKRKIKRIVGGIIKINLNDGTYTYGRILEEPLIAFYDIRTDIPIDITEIIKAKVIFKLWVMNYSITSGHWEIIGNIPLEKDMLVTPYFFKQDPIDKNKIFLYKDGKETQATPIECKNLERAAVWEPEHVEDRLRDCFNNKPNKWVESLKLKI